MREPQSAVPRPETAPMRVVLDVRPAVFEPGGFGWHTRQLVNALAEVDQETSYRLLAFFAGNRRERLNRCPAPPGPNFEARVPGRTVCLVQAALARTGLSLPAGWLAGPYDVYHSMTGLGCLPPAPRPLVVTIHDVIPLDHAEWSRPGLPARFRRAWERSLRSAAAVIAVSETTRRDILRHWPDLSRKVRVCMSGADGRFDRLRDRARFDAARASLGLPGRFILSVGRLETRKNGACLIQAFSRLSERHPDLHLVLAGEPGYGFEAVRARREASPARARIHIGGYASDQDLNVLYNAATVFAFPSLYEGFGLPPIEAMRCGTPVLVSDRGSLPEIVGDAALVVENVESPEALERGLAALLDDKELCRTLIERGLRQAAKYSWTDFARGVIEVYREVAGESTPGRAGRSSPDRAGP